MISIHITEIGQLDTLIHDVSSRRKSLMNRLGKAGERALKEHFLIRDSQTPNKKGWPQAHFWNRIKDRTNLAYVTEESAGVAISDPAINQKIYGGKIKAKRGGNLALPAQAAAYAAGSPREGATPALKFMFAYDTETQHWRPALFAVETGSKQVKDRRKGHEGEMRTAPDPKQPSGIWYWLVKSVTQVADPLALPDDGTVMNHYLSPVLNDFFNSLGVRA